MKTYIYTRVSTSKQEYEQQLRTIRLYLEQNGIVPDGMFEEKEHGTVAAENRELKNAIYACQKGGQIIVSEISRVSRMGEKDRHKIQEMLENRGAQIYCINEKFTVGKKSEQLSDSILGLIHFSQAKTERDNISQRSKSALRAKKEIIMQQGFFISKSGRIVEKLGNPNWKEEDILRGNRKSAQVRADRVKSNPAFRQAYTMALMMREKGEKNEVIAQKMNGMGMRTPRGCLYIPASIPQLIRMGNKLLKSDL